MSKYIALLRGINVSGQKKLKMAELKSVLSDAGLLEVQTYIQSGNVVFESDKSPETSQNLIQKVILEAFGFEVPTLVLLQSELQKIVSSNPFLDHIEETKKLYVCFLLEEPTNDRTQILKEADLKGDEYMIKGEKILYTCYHKGMGKTKMDNNFLEAKLKVKATTRNWRTVSTLAEL